MQTSERIGAKALATATGEVAIALLIAGKTDGEALVLLHTLIVSAAKTGQWIHIVNSEKPSIATALNPAKHRGYLEIWKEAQACVEYQSNDLRVMDALSLLSEMVKEGAVNGNYPARAWTLFEHMCYCFRLIIDHEVDREDVDVKNWRKFLDIVGDASCPGIAKSCIDECTKSLSIKNDFWLLEHIFERDDPGIRHDEVRAKVGRALWRAISFTRHISTKQLINLGRLVKWPIQYKEPIGLHLPYSKIQFPTVDEVVETCINRTELITGFASCIAAIAAETKKMGWKLFVIKDISYSLMELRINSITLHTYSGSADICDLPSDAHRRSIETAGRVAAKDITKILSDYGLNHDVVVILENTELLPKLNEEEPIIIELPLQ